MSAARKEPRYNYSMPRIGIPKELKDEQIVEACFSRVEQLCVNQSQEVNDIDFKCMLGLFLEDLETEIQEMRNEKTQSFTRR